MKYEIDNNNAIRMWHDGEEVPFLFQPDYPNGTPFADKADAENWAKAKMTELEDINAPEAPSFPGEEPKKQWRLIKLEKDNAMQTAISKLVNLGLTEEEAIAIAGRDI